MLRMNSVFVVALGVLAVLVGAAGVARAGLVANWTFDEGAAAATAHDYVGGYNGVVDTSSGYGPTTGATGRIGNCYNYPYHNQNSNSLGGVSVPGPNTLMENWTNLTISCWIYETVVNQNQFLVEKTHDYYYPQTTMAIPYTGTEEMMSLRSATSTSGSQAFSPALSSAALVNAWHLITGTFDGSTGTTKVYLDGVLEATAVNALITSTGTTDPTNGSGAYAVLIGAEWRTSQVVFNGLLDDVSMWNNTLPIERVAAIYHTPNATGLGAYNATDMSKLFTAYDGQTTATVEGRTWQYVASGLPGSLTGANQAGQLGTGQYYVQLDGVGGGVETLIPEPGTLALLAAGLVGLLCYAWRKRK